MKSYPSEIALINGLAQDERGAVETIYRQHYPMVQQMVLKNNGSVDDARDIFQEAMIVLFEKARSGNFELHCLLKTYLYSVCRRLWLKRLQQQKRFVMAELNEEIVPVEEELDSHLQKQAEVQLMEASMERLGEPCRSLLDAYYIKKKPMVEIATDFGYTNADNAKNQKYKCLLRLKKLFFATYKNTMDHDG